MKAPKQRPARMLVVVALLVCILLFGFSLCVGRYPLRLSALIARDPMTTRVFYTLRLPRTVLAATVGFALAVAGFVYQLVFRNPLAAPDIIGVSSGAGTGAAVAILFFGGGAVVTAVSAFTGGITAVLLALVIAGVGKKKQIATFVLSGIAVNALMQAALMALKLTADPEKQLASIEFWTMGSLASSTLQKLPWPLLLMGCGLVGIFLLYRPLLFLTLGDDEARMMGVPVERLRRVVLLLATLIVAAAVSVTGLITFIGLIAPHLARLLTGSSKKESCLLAGLLGSALLLAADCAARGLLGTEVPISILTSLLGAPFLVWLVCREERVP